MRKPSLSCSHNNFTNFGGGYADAEPHLYCHVCKSHWYNGREWTRAEWDAYVNEVTP
jgi:hypothetical protein